MLNQLYYLAISYMPPIVCSKKNSGRAKKRFDGPFDYLSDYTVNSKSMAGTYRSIYKLMCVLAVMGFFITVTWGFTRLIAIKNGAIRNEEKSAIIFKMVVIAIVCALTSIVTFIQGFWENFL